jgi:FKBP-type peptidyl-prolyl cis-trans isomerase 2
MARKKKEDEAQAGEPQQQSQENKETAEQKAENHEHNHDHDHEHEHHDAEAEAKKKAEEEALAKRKQTYAGKKVEPGAILKLDVYARTVDEIPVTFIASNDTDAKELPNYDPKRHYHPDFYTVGETIDLPLKVKEKIDASNYFDEFELVLEPADAYGVRKGDLVKQLNAKKVEKELGKEIRVGMTYTDKETQQTGTIIRNNQGRCLVDFNHPLVDRKCMFKVKIIDAYVTPEEKIQGIFAKNGLADIEYTMNSETKDIEVIVPDALKFNQQWIQQGWQIKFMLSMDLQRNCGVNDVKFAEIYKNFSKNLPKTEEKPAEGEKKE